MIGDVGGLKVHISCYSWIRFLSRKRTIHEIHETHEINEALCSSAFKAKADDY